ncbi:Formylglycine-generating enzyme, required for sulfatase activity, contains SUMF1/FGE domain [Cohnella sp. OV330]|uniref:formylglycine-generating enzyme family protein n=1 Tax=Cohnella sp. OV330 TaxID=1855288 RepID=UPI0008E115B8|nr:SUMF1/EgtB/PvdO family nonheme iron enzyme [Cohnella sp. OV330]SFA74637.1 Formylglycine-generating enzyme, required for sulfatase activity, contains SUMF1/FGE domain [Cohnella sp. OV330]
MRKQVLMPLAVVILLATVACSNDEPAANERLAATEKPAANDNFVLIKGGHFTNAKSGYYGKEVTVPDLYMSRYEVTQKEWTDVMGGNPSAFKGDRLPVQMANWYDAIEYCNRRSFKEGLKPYYDIDKTNKDPNNRSENDPLKWTVTIRKDADGYRLPTEAEWEYAAGGGAMSKSYTYSGSDLADEVAWYWRNAGERQLSGAWNWPAIENNRTQPRAVGGKKPNELGLYDMSGNVREWCWDWYADPELGSGTYRVVKGGGWMGDVGSAEPAYRGKFEASGVGPDQGFRVVRG